MLDVLNNSPLLVLFVVLTLGAVLGAVPVGPIRFGAAAALFVGLVAGAFLPEVGPQLGLLQNLGLAMFAYLIGLTAGQAFFRDLRRNWPLMLGAVVAIVLTAVIAVLAGGLLGLDRPTAVGAFAGALTSTPSMALAQDITGTTDPAVGYSIAYLFGIVFTIVIIQVVSMTSFRGERDPAIVTAQELVTRTALVTRASSVAELNEVTGGKVRVVAIRRGRMTRTVTRLDEIHAGDRVLLDGAPDDVSHAVGFLGKLDSRHMVGSLGGLQMRPFILSSSALAHHRVDQLSLHRQFGATLTRVRRDDGELLARDDLELKLGDRVMVVAPRWRMQALQNFFGHSTRSISDIDWVSLGAGLALSYLVALVVVPLPGGASFALGSAAGGLVVGLVLGSIGRTGSTVWQVPAGLNLSLRQFGLMMFNGAVGLASGPAFMATVATPVGLKSVAMAAIVAVTACGLMTLASFALRQSTPRTMGALSGLLAQPATLDYATTRSKDARVMSGYAQIFAIALLVKISVVPFML